MAESLAQPDDERDRVQVSRNWIWRQLLIGWLPVWALYTTLILTAHGGSPLAAAFNGLRAVLAAALLGLLVRRLTDRLPWPERVRPRFVFAHVVAAGAYAVAWVTSISAMESLLHAHFVIVAPAGVASFVVLGVWLYVMVAGISYATQATERAALAEALAARSQLAALRAQLNPHFLFNALHTVVQLIPNEPKRASQAAEQLADLLRTAIEEDRDLVTLDEEVAFVSRYLDLERLRFGERLVLHVRIAPNAGTAIVPSFTLQTLVENAVRHGAAPNVSRTEISIAADVHDSALTLSVHDTGVGGDSQSVMSGEGTGLKRLRDRLAALYGSAARLTFAGKPGEGFTASVSLPLRAPEATE